MNRIQNIGNHHTMISRGHLKVLGVVGSLSYLEKNKYFVIGRYSIIVSLWYCHQTFLSSMKTNQTF